MLYNKIILKLVTNPELFWLNHFWHSIIFYLPKNNGKTKNILGKLYGFSKNQNFFPKTYIYTLRDYVWPIFKKIHNHGLNSYPNHNSNFILLFFFKQCFFRTQKNQVHTVFSIKCHLYISFPNSNEQFVQNMEAFVELSLLFFKIWKQYIHIHCITW